jgi:hypothetical protein
MDQAADLDEFPPLEDIEMAPDPDAEPKTRTRKPRADAGKPRQPRTASTTKLASDLAEPLAIIGSMLAMTMPTAGTVIAVRSEETAKALVKMAAKRPKMLAALQRMSEVGPASELVQTIIMVIIAAQIDVGKAEPDGMIAQAVGVTPIWVELNGAIQEVREEAKQDTGGFGQFDMTPPPAPGYDENGIFNAPPMFTAGPGAGIIN